MSLSAMLSYCSFPLQLQLRASVCVSYVTPTKGERDRRDLCLEAFNI